MFSIVLWCVSLFSTLAADNSVPTLEQLKKQDEERAARISQVDPLLKDACEYFYDCPEKRREESVRKFLAFIEKNPESPFRAEIYYYIAVMYDGQLSNPKFAAQEPQDTKSALKYLAMASDLYGDKFSHENIMAKMGLAFSRLSPQGGLDFQKRLYELIRRFSRGVSADDIWPVPPAMACVRQGDPDVISIEDRKKMADDLSGSNNSMSTFMSSITKNILHFAGPIELADLAESYPDEDLGKRALEKLNKINGQTRENFVENIHLEPTSSPTTPTAIAATAELQQKPEPAFIQAPAEDVADSKAQAPARDSNGILPILLVLGGGLGVIGLVVAFRKRSSFR